MPTTKWFRKTWSTVAMMFVPPLPPTLLLQLDDDVAALRPVTGPPLLAPTSSAVSVAASQVGRVVVSLFDLLRDPQAQEPLRRLPSSPGTTSLSRHHLIAFAGAALSPTPPPPPFVGRSPVWLSPSSITCGGARFGGCRAQLCTAELDLVVLELSWSNCELAPVGEMASTICFASAQSHVDAGKAIGTAHI